MVVNKLVRLRGKFIIGNISRMALMLIGVCISDRAKISKSASFEHNAIGCVIHDNSVIEDDVKIYQGVTLGRADVYREGIKSKMTGITIKKGAILCAGAKILCKEGNLVVGENTVIGANAVLTCSTGNNEIWAGNPARLIKKRED